MTTDVGFLATGLTPLKETFGMEFGTGNPFALPCAPSLNAIVTRESGSGSGKGNGKADKGKAGVEKGKGTTAGRSATGKEAAPGCTRARGAAEKHAKQSVLSVRGATGDIKSGGGGASDTPADNHGNGNANKPPAAVSATAAAEAKQTGVEGSTNSGTPKGDGVVQIDVEVGPRLSDEEDRLNKLKNSEQEGGGVEVERGGESASIHEVLRVLGDVDEEQRVRLARAQRFLEEEVARQVKTYPTNCHEPRDEHVEKSALSVIISECALALAASARKTLKSASL